MRVLLRAPFDRYSGYGNDGVDLALFMSKAGVDVTPWPLNLVPGLPHEFTRLLNKNPGGHHDVVLTFAPPFDLRPSEFCKLADKAVGYTMWESTRIQRCDMVGHGWDMRRKHKWWDDLDLLLVTCDMNVECFRSLDHHVPIQVLPCGVDGDMWPGKRRDPASPMKFGMIGMLTGRKDPFLLIDAWRELKREVPDFDAILELKTNCAGVHPKICDIVPDMVLHERAWSHEELLAWYYSINVLVSTSRGEGNNKPAMEFMATGGAVIATDWSGHQNWLHPAVSYPLRGEVCPMGQDPEGPWNFRADKDHLKELILHCWRNRPEVVEKGWNARSWILSTLSWERVAEKLEKILVSL